MVLKPCRLSLGLRSWAASRRSLRRFLVCLVGLAHLFGRGVLLFRRASQPLQPNDDEKKWNGGAGINLGHLAGRIYPIGQSLSLSPPTYLFLPLHIQLVLEVVGLCEPWCEGLPCDFVRT